MQNFFGAEEGGERCVDFEGIFETLFISIYCFKVISYTDSIEREWRVFFFMGKYACIHIQRQKYGNFRNFLTLHLCQKMSKNCENYHVSVFEYEYTRIFP